MLLLLLCFAHPVFDRSCGSSACLEKLGNLSRFLLTRVQTSFVAVKSFQLESFSVVNLMRFYSNHILKWKSQLQRWISTQFELRSDCIQGWMLIKYYKSNLRTFKTALLTLNHRWIKKCLKNWFVLDCPLKYLTSICLKLLIVFKVTTMQSCTKILKTQNSPGMSWTLKNHSGSKLREAKIFYKLSTLP